MSSLKGWHAWAKPHQAPHVFTLKLSSLTLAMLYSAPADPEGFTLALFTPDIAVDARGKVLVLKMVDFKGLRDLADRAKDVPPTGSFRNTWQILHTPERTSQPIDRIITSRPGSGDVLEPASVQGWDESLTELKLKRPVGEYTHLPEELAELVELGREGRRGYVKGEEDEIVMQKVREVLRDI